MHSTRAYGVAQIDTHRLEKRGAVALTFAGRYNMPLVAEEYARLPNIRYAEPNYMAGDGDDVCLLIDGTKHLYVFDAGSGDCPAGCIDHTYWGFAVDVKGQSHGAGHVGKTTRRYRARVAASPQCL